MKTVVTVVDGYFICHFLGVLPCRSKRTGTTSCKNSKIFRRQQRCPALPGSKNGWRRWVSSNIWKMSWNGVKKTRWISWSTLRWGVSPWFREKHGIVEWRIGVLQLWPIWPWEALTLPVCHCHNFLNCSYWDGHQSSSIHSDSATHQKGFAFWNGWQFPIYLPFTIDHGT